jgi:hypothetical protein
MDIAYIVLSLLLTAITVGLVHYLDRLLGKRS